MLLKFPDNFFFGTSTSAYQIETAFEHDWTGLVARDGSVFDRTTDHELRLEEDVQIIRSLAPHYRLSLMWSKLQRHPYARLDADAKQYYHSLLRSLREHDVGLMMVIYHWCNPVWFSKNGGWMRKENVAVWIDFAKQLVDEFGKYVSLWNTFNEPNLYATLAYSLGEFPPYKRNPATALTVIRNMRDAHNVIYEYIKDRFPQTLVGISHNCATFTAENFMGRIPSRLAQYWYLELLPKYFAKCDFTGISYYARVRFDPAPLTNLYTPAKIKKLNLPSDDIWEYFPQGLISHIENFWNIYRKPIIITENGICTQNDAMRITAIKDYMKVVHDALRAKIPVIGYYHWSAWDNFEWTLGMDYRFGLYSCDRETRTRTPKESAGVYARLSHRKEIEV